MKFGPGIPCRDFDNTYPLAAEGSRSSPIWESRTFRRVRLKAACLTFGFNDGSITVASSPGLTNPISNKTIVVGDNLTWINGRHTIKTGVEVQCLIFKDISGYNTGDDYGEYYFNSGTPGVNSYTGNAFADFLLGLPIQTAKALNGPDFNPYSSCRPTSCKTAGVSRRS